MARQINVGLSNTIGQLINSTNTMSVYLGDLDNLTTTADSNIVTAINSLKTAVDTLDSGSGGTISLIGDLTTLDTTDKSSVVAAINELDDRIDSASDFRSYFSGGTDILLSGGTITHDNTTRSNTTSTDNPASEGSFQVVSSITSNARGHITAVDTSTVTLPSTLSLNGTAVTATAAEINKLSGFTGTSTDLNYAKDLNATGVTSIEYSKLDGIDSNIQAQFDAINTDLVNDTTPQLGGTLDTNSQAIQFGSWTIVLDSSDLEFRFANVAVFKLASNGAVTSAADITAFGTP
jgi:hypothetical protein